MIIFQMVLFVYCFILAIDIHKAKDTKNVLERGFISLMMMLAMLVVMVAK